jgi:hypothetical protein
MTIIKVRRSIIEEGNFAQRIAENPDFMGKVESTPIG